MNPLSILSFLGIFLLSGVGPRVAEAVRGGDPEAVLGEIATNAVLLLWLCAAFAAASVVWLARFAAEALPMADDAAPFAAGSLSAEDDAPTALSEHFGA